VSLLLGEAGEFAQSPDSRRGCFKNVEQLNIVGKRSGEGFVAHRAKLVNALSRVMAERLLLMDFTIGRKGLLGYIKALSGSNVVKIVPASSNGNASDTQVADKRLKVVCGANSSFLSDMAWIGDKTPMTIAELRVSPDNTIKPNLGSLELAEALNRVLPFTATDEKRVVLQSVLIRAKDGELQLVGADGFRLSVVALKGFENGGGQVLIHRDELSGIANALRKARRVSLAMEKGGESLEGMRLVIDTEAIRYRWDGQEGNYPDFEKLIPTECATIAHFDAVEALKAIASLKAILDNSKSFAIDLAIGDGAVVMTNPDEIASTTIPADTDGQGFVRVDGQYFASALKACGGMVDFKLTNAYSPMLFTADGCQVVVMPLMSNKAKEQQEQDIEARKTEAEPTEAELAAIEAEAQAVAKAKAEAHPEAKGKRSRSSKSKRAVAVASAV